MNANAAVELLPARRSFHRVDMLRVFATLCVIALHTEPFMEYNLYEITPLTAALARLFDLLCLWAVPFFFIASGFFFARGLCENGTEHALRRFAWRIIPPMLMVNAFYAFWPGIIPMLMTDGAALGRRLHTLNMMIQTRPVHALLYGTSMHLWFLTALLLAACLVCLMRMTGLRRWLPYVAAALFLVGLSGQAYGSTGWFPAFSFNTRTGPFFGFPLFWLGTALAEGRYRISSALGVALAAAGLVICLFEDLILAACFDAVVQHYYIGTALGAYGLFSWAVADSGKDTVLARIGPLTFGVYLMHMAVLKELNALDWEFSYSYSGQLVMPFIVLFFTLALVYPFSRLGQKRPAPARMAA